MVNVALKCMRITYSPRKLYIQICCTTPYGQSDRVLYLKWWNAQQMQTIKYIVNRSNPWKIKRIYRYRHFYSYYDFWRYVVVSFDAFFQFYFISFIVIHPRKHIVNDHKLNITIVYGLIWILNYISYNSGFLCWCYVQFKSKHILQK